MPHIVPNKSVMTIAVLAVVAGTVLTLLYLGNPSSAAHHASAATTGNITPTLSSSDASAPLDVTVNGAKVPGHGTTTVPTAGGTATVTVNGDSASVDSTGPTDVQTNTPSGDINISVHSTSSTNSSVHSSSRTVTSSRSSSSTTVNGDSSTNVHVQTSN